MTEKELLELEIMEEVLDIPQAWLEAASEVFSGQFTDHQSKAMHYKKEWRLQPQQCQLHQSF